MTQALSIRLKTISPVIVPRLGGEPNSAVSLGYIPGSQLRGAAIAAYGGQQGKQELVLEETELRNFFSDSVRFLNAYPADTAGNRSLPVPLSWRVGKYEPTDILDLLHASRDFEGQNGQPERKMEALGERFYLPADEGAIHLLAPEKQVAVHTMRDPAKGRATEEKGAVFRYESIAAGESFVALITAEKSEDLERLERLFADGEQWIGGSRSAGYGHMKVEAVERIELARESGRPSISSDDSIRELGISLLSDLIAREPMTGQFSLNFGLILAQALGLPDEAVEVTNAFWASTEVGGFNRKWRSPLPRARALSLGSHFKVKFSQPVQGSDILQLAELGLGERRNEGFGRIGIDLHQRESYRPVVQAAGRSTELPVALSEEHARFLVNQVLTPIYANRLDRALLSHINSIDFVHKGWTKSQIGNVRSQIYAVQQEKEFAQATAKVLDFIAKMMERRKSDEKYKPSKIAGKDVDAWINEVLENPDGAFAKWADSVPIPKYERTGIGSEEESQLKNQYAFRLVDEVLERMAKDQSEKDKAQ